MSQKKSRKRNSFRVDPQSSSSDQSEDPSSSSERAQNQKKNKNKNKNQNTNNNKNKNKNKNQNQNKKKTKKKSQKQNNKKTISTFQDFSLDKTIIRSLKKNTIETPNELQKVCLPKLLTGESITMTSNMKSGKAICFLIRAVELLRKYKFRQRNGVGAIVVCQNHEIAEEVNQLSKALLKNQSQNCGVVVEGANKQAEKKKLRIGVNLLIGTPQRLLYHLKQTPELITTNLKYIVVDQAEKFLKAGSDFELEEIFKSIKNRFELSQNNSDQFNKLQIVITSNKKDDNVHQLHNILRRRPKKNQKEKEKEKGKGKGDDIYHYIQMKEKLEYQISENLTQGYVICEPEKRLLLLITLLRRLSTNSKIIICFNSIKSAEFHSEILSYSQIPSLLLYNKMEKLEKNRNILKFKTANQAILCTTCNTISNIKFESVAMLVQYDPPIDEDEYLYTISKFSQYNPKMRTLLFLQPIESHYLKSLKKMKLAIKEFAFPKNLFDYQKKLEKMVNKTYILYNLAREAYRGFVLAYSSHSRKDCFNIQELDLLKISKSFCFEFPPKVDFEKTIKRRNRYKRRRFLNKKKN
ncbi:atp-dependent RNA helicase ddx18 [Anaeramoeba flamelloides]|uniref:ATP-dependent RNA helicase n=1 Tax=Anaeramoeba flamelloides TaxID=1746091 RepID=A0ABQ8YJ05_9EUKA|nr:atp-dependent RNA helicase ddx18 [Anaeramoeba flamelloides]